MEVSPSALDKSQARERDAAAICATAGNEGGQKAQEQGQIGFYKETGFFGVLWSGREQRSGQSARVRSDHSSRIGVLGVDPITFIRMS